MRSSCVTVEMKSSFRRSSSCSRRLARAQLVRRRLELARFLLELAAVGEHLGGLVDDVHHLVEVERLFLHHRGHHHAGRRAADGAGQQRLGVVHQVGVGRERLHRLHAALPGVGRERLLRPLRPEETAEQRQQVVDGGAAAPERGPAPAAGCLSASTNSVAWLCSAALARLKSETPT